jgi:glycolate oxidase iron-sulfur subunit
MQDMKKLARLLKKVEDQLIVCMRCGMCQSVCPVFAETGREADVARGKLALLDGLLREAFKDPTGVQERLSRCLLCGSCAANCPSGVKVLDIFIKARVVITSFAGLSPVKKILFRKLLAQPALFDRLLEWGARFQGIFIHPVDDLLGTSCARFVSPLGDRHFSALAPEPFHRRVRALNTQIGSSKLKVAFFTGCLIDKVFPKIGTAVLQALSHHGVGVFIPGELGCCGIPALSAGDTDTFNKLLHHNLKELRSQNFDYLITACATCTSTIKKLWPTMAETLTPQALDGVTSLAEKTLDISEFLVEKCGVQLKPKHEPVQKPLITYHDPCHLKKSLGIAVQPRIVLQANTTFHFEEMKEADKCCGCGGSFNLQHYGLSSTIGRHKRDNIVDSGCSVVTTSCPACMLQISDMLSQANDRVEVKHVVEVYVGSLEKS